MFFLICFLFTLVSLFSYGQVFYADDDTKSTGWESFGKSEPTTPTVFNFGTQDFDEHCYVSLGSGIAIAGILGLGYLKMKKRLLKI